MSPASNKSSFEWVQCQMSPALSKSSFDQVQLSNKSSIEQVQHQTSSASNESSTSPVLNESNIKQFQLQICPFEWVQHRMNSVANESHVKQLQQQSSCWKLKEVTNMSFKTQLVCFRFCWDFIVDSHSIAVVWICSFESLEGLHDILIVEFVVFLGCTVSQITFGKTKTIFLVDLL